MGPQILSPGDDHLERRPPREGLFARCRRCRGLEGLEGFAKVKGRDVNGFPLGRNTITYVFSIAMRKTKVFIRFLLV